MAERLHFNTGMVYESMMAAEHLSRYWMLREACRGKRVLDVACGEGYGSALLRSWGAAEVVGVDISDDAIDNATQLFGAQGIRFLQGDACDLDSVLDTGTQYDLIACFETLEHVPDVPALLHGLHKRLAPGGSMAVSCPNDVEVSTEPNEYHLRTYTFEEFKDTATAVLGEPVQWHLGTSMIGFGICESTDAWALGQGTSLRNMLDGADALPARMLPAQSGHELSPASAYFYVGVWGSALPRTVVAAPIAYRAYTTPWNSWVAAKGQVDALEVETATSYAENRHLADALRHAETRLDVSLAQLTALEVQQQTLQREATQRAQHLANDRTARLQMADALHTRLQRIRHLEAEWMVLNEFCADAVKQRDAAHARADAVVSELGVLRASRVHRLGQRYYRSFEHPATRWFARPLRRIAAAFRRMTKSS